MDPKKKSRLGRGLSSLMGVGQDFGVAEIPVDAPLVGDSATVAAVHREVPRGTPVELDVDRIDPNPHQPRRIFADATLSELADSIRANGVIQPIVVVARGDRFELIAGERRLRASKLAGRDVIPAYVRETDALTQAQMALVENIQREDLNPADRAAGYRALIEELGLTQADLAVRLGEDRSTIANHLRLLDLVPDVLEGVRTGALTLGHGKVLAGIADPTEQARLGKLAVEQHLSVRNLERLIAQPAVKASEVASTTKTQPSAHLRDLEVNLSKQLGLRVQVKAGANKAKGRVVIHYQTLDEFDALMEKVGARLDD